MDISSCAETVLTQSDSHAKSDSVFEKMCLRNYRSHVELNVRPAFENSKAVY